MATNEETVAARQLYVSYYGRPADPAGLAFWMGEFTDSDNVDDAVKAFGTSAEFTALSAGLSNAELVNALYQQMFNRDADAEGLAFYLMRLDNNEASLASIALQIADGVQGDDVTTLANKVAVANTFTADVDTKEAAYAEGDIAEAQALLSAVDATAASVATGNAAATALVDAIVAASGGGVAYTLTPGTDIIESGIGDDTYAATTTTLNATDIIVDSGTADSDTLSVVATTETETAAATVSGVEAISVELDVFKGAGAAFNAANVSGAVITLWSDKLGFDGDATVEGLGNNSATAGNNVTSLTANGVKDGTVNTGGATTVMAAVAADFTAVGPTINIEGAAVTLTITDDAATRVTINNDAEASVTLLAGLEDAADATILTGAGDLTLTDFTGNVFDGSAGTLVNGKTSGTVTLVNFNSKDGDNYSNIDADIIVLSASSGAITVASGQTFGLIIDQTTLTTTTDLDLSTDTVNVVSTVDQTALILGTKGGSNLTLAADGLTIGRLTGSETGAATNLVAVGDATVEELNLGAIAGTLNASAVAGDFTLGTAPTPTEADSGGFSGLPGSSGVIEGTGTVGGGIATIIGSATGANTIYVSTGAASVDITTGAAADRVITLGSLRVSDDKVAANLGAGNDVVLAGAGTALGHGSVLYGVGPVAPLGVLVIDGGTGFDILLAFGGSDFTQLALTTVGVEVLAVGSLGDADTAGPPDEIVEAHTLTTTAKQLHDKSYIVATGDAQALALDTLEITTNLADTDESLDLSGLIPFAGVSFVVNGADGAAQAIVGSFVNDTITAGTGAVALAAGNSVTGGGGDNTFVFGVDDSTMSAMTTITDYTSATNAAQGREEDNDTLNIAATVALNSTQAGSATIFAGATNTVTVAIINGVLSVIGLSADVALVDTLAEMVTLALAATANGEEDAVVFEFGGDTYLVEDDGGDAAADNEAVNIIRLEGLTGVEQLTDDAGLNGDNTVFIA